MSHYDLLDKIEVRRQKILSGKVNCIPSPFKRFSNDFVGIEQGKYVCVTAATKAGKTQITNFLFVYNTLLYAYEHPDQIRLKIMYFNLEESEDNITLRFMSNLLYKYSKGNVRLDNKDLKSTKAQQPISESIILQLRNEEPYKSILDFYDEVVEFRPERHPTGIMKAIEKYCLEHGTVKKKPIEIINDYGVKETIEVFDGYIPDDDDLYIIPIIDHFGNLDSESGLTIKGCMDLLSKYLVKLRNRYNISPIAVVQQAMDGESLEHFKAKKLRPTVAGLGDSRTIARDFDLMLGLFSPFRHELPEYFGYNIQKFRDHIRFLEVNINREGEGNGICPLYFDGKTNTFKELPLPNDPLIQTFYNTINHLNLTLTVRKQRKILKKGIFINQF